MASFVRVYQEDIALGERIVGDVTLSNPYTVGGEAITAEMVGARAGAVLDVKPGVLNDGNAASLFEWDAANGKLLALDPACAELGAVDLSGVTVRCEVIVGRSTV